MSAPGSDKVFTGSIARLYEERLVPLIFEPYAADLANRLRGRALSDVLEIAAGTGVVTRALARTLPESAAPAIAYCQGTPLRSEIEARGPARLAEATDVAAAAIAERFGRAAVDGKIQALVVTVQT